MSEMSEHRVPMLGASWRRFEDPSRSRDPKVRAVVGALATLPSPAPRDEFRAELRAQLVAIAPRVIAESSELTTPFGDVSRRKAAVGATGVVRHRDGAFGRLAGLRVGRALTIAATVVTAFAMLFGGAVWMSQKALPGDTLYGLKRASESWQLATASSSTEKARDYLKFARTRVDEARQLASRAAASAAGAGPQAGGVDGHTAALITSTLASADHDVTSATALLGRHAVKTRSAGSLTVLTTWAPGQLTRLHELAAAMPDSALRNRAESSASLVDEALTRAKQLAPEVASPCLARAETDSLGPVPVETCASSTSPGATPAKGHQQTSGARHGSTTSSGTRGGGSAVSTSGGAAQPQSTSTVGAPAGGSSSSGSSSSGGIINLPTLPTSTSSAPVQVNSCGLDVSLGPLGLGLNVCSSG
jgi:Domain of unknown function (DUF5667)